MKPLVLFARRSRPLSASAVRKRNSVLSEKSPYSRADRIQPPGASTRSRPSRTLKLPASLFSIVHPFNVPSNSDTNPLAGWPYAAVVHSAMAAMSPRTGAFTADLLKTVPNERYERYESDALEVLFDLAPRQPQHHRPAVGADRGVRGAPQLVEDVRHLLVRQRIVRLHRRMAGHRRRDALDRVVHLGAAIESFQVLGQRPNRRIALLPAQHHRVRRDPQQVAAELFELETESLEIGGMRRERLARGRRQLHEQRFQQALALETPGRQPLGEPLEQDALVRHVLVDDRDAFLVHGDDEGVAELPERHHRTDDGGRVVTRLCKGCDRCEGGGCKCPGIATSSDTHHRVVGAFHAGSRSPPA